MPASDNGVEEAMLKVDPGFEREVGIGLEEVVAAEESMGDWELVELDMTLSLLVKCVQKAGGKN